MHDRLHVLNWDEGAGAYTYLEFNTPVGPRAPSTDLTGFHVGVYNWLARTAPTVAERDLYLARAQRCYETIHTVVNDVQYSRGKQWTEAGFDSAAYHTPLEA
jgi:hypothetical protein